MSETSEITIGPEVVNKHHDAIKSIEEIDMDPRELAQAHLDGNSVRLPSKEGETRKEFILSLRRRCVDGRHTAEQAENSFAFAGADVGLVMALSRASEGRIDVISAYKAVSKALSKLGSSFFYHTDTHAQHDEHSHDGGVTFGCGHAAKPMDAALAKEYGIDPQAQLELIKLIKSGELEEGMASLDETVLDGNHNEAGVLVVDSEDLTVLPMDENGNQFFVYDLKLIHEFMQIVWDQLLADKNVSLEGITFDDFVKAEEAQRDVTVDELASKKGKPTFAASEQEGQLVISGTDA